MKRLKTIHIDSEMGWSGGQRQVSALCAYLRDQGHEVKIICRPDSKLEKWAGEQAIASLPVQMKTILSPSAVFGMRSILKAEQPDIVHLHASKAHVLGSAAARMAGCANVVVTRRMDEPVKLIWPNTSAYGSWTTAVIAISEAVKGVLIESGVDAGKIKVINSGAQVERFAGAVADPNLRRSLGIAAEAAIVCTAATLAERKGISYLIEAAAILNGEGKAIHLVIAGEGEQRAELEFLVSERGVSASFVGFRPDMPELIAACDVFTMPALAEGLGIAVIEAMAAGKPVVASAVGGLRESVIDGETGYLIPSRDSQALAGALRMLIDDPERAARFGAAGQARARSHFSLENMAARNEAFYFELLASSPS